MGFRSLLHEHIFMMQTAEYGSLHNPIPDRQTGANLVGHGLTGRPGPNTACGLLVYSGLPNPESEISNRKLLDSP
jgi:hypothetical protein